MANVVADKVTVQLEAQTQQYNAEMQKTGADFKRVAEGIKADAISIGNSAQVGANMAVSAFSRAGNAANSMNVGNIAAQFQDIGVTAAMGMNPMIVALQQGTQLSAVLNQSVAAGVSPARMLGQAFAQIVNPISLATIAAVALGTAAIQYFTTLINDGRMSNEELKKQNDIVRDVAKRWGDAIPSLKAYVDELDRAKEGVELGVARELLETNIWEDLRGQVADWRVELAAARIDLQAFGASAQEVDALQSEFDRLAAKVADGSASIEDLDALMKILSGTTGANVIPSLVSLQGVLAGVAAQLRDAATAQNELNRAFAADSQVSAYTKNADFIAEQQRINSLTAEQLTLEREVARVKAEADRSETLISDQQALDIATQRLAAEERRRKLAEEERNSNRAGNKLASEAEREAKAVLDLIDALEHELAIVGLTNEEKAVANALRQAGAAATDEQRAKIEELIRATEAERASIEAVTAHMEEMRDAARSAMETIIDGFIEGKDAGDIFSDVLKNIGSQLINLGLNSLFGGGGVSGPGLFGKMFGGARAAGGPVQSGKAYLVGEKGPEIFSPSTSGMITANDRIGGDTISLSFAPSITVQDGSAESLAKVQQAVAKQAVEFEGRVKKIVRERGHKWR